MTGPHPTSDRKPELAPAMRKRLMVIGGIVALAALAFGANYLIYSSRHVSTDNAQVDGDQIQITAPATGTLVKWTATQGATLRENEVIGRIRTGGSGAGSQRVVRAPDDGTVGLSAAVDGARVSEGEHLATVYDLSEIYATARIDETDIGDVRPNAPVDIEVDAYPDIAMTGVVQQIQAGSAGVFSVLPELTSTGNAQDVTQVIPVRIVFRDTGGAMLVPGMSMTVHIGKD